jgi:hypothetical protein
MDNLSDWLYIILLAIAGISGILSSGKKKKQSEEVQRQHDVDNSMPEAIWEVMPEATQMPHPVRFPNKIPHTQLKSGSSFKEGERSIASTHSEQTVEKTFPENFGALGEDFRDIDELKKAIIYSEILNRKY